MHKIHNYAIHIYMNKQQLRLKYIVWCFIKKKKIVCGISIPNNEVNFINYSQNAAVYSF